MLTAQGALEESGGRLTLVELKVLVHELYERETALKESSKALRRFGRWRDARDVENRRKGIERERKVAERRIRQAEGDEG